MIESEHCLAQDQTVLHVSAENPVISLTKLQLREAAQRIAYCLRHSYGIGANGPNKDVVTVIGYGQPLAPAAFFGVIASGGVYSAASPSSTSSELTRQIKLGHSKLIICSSELVGVVTKSANDCGIPWKNVLILESEPSWLLLSLDERLNLLTEARLGWVKITDERELRDSLIAIVWSSGTTGVPKGEVPCHCGDGSVLTRLNRCDVVAHQPRRLRLTFGKLPSEPSRR